MSMQKDNLLDYIPKINTTVNYIKEDKKITLLVMHQGVINWIAKKLFFMPNHTKLSFDSYGSFIWSQIDGHRTIHEIASRLRDEYGEDVEPLYERLIQFLMILKQQKFITLIKP